jgi:hypothetical protein
MSEITLDALRKAGKITWAASERVWVGDPDDIVRALRDEGFEEYKREIAQSGRGYSSAGGLWQGLNTRTGAVGSAIWVRTGSAALVVVDIDGRRVEAEALHVESAARTRSR